MAEEEPAEQQSFMNRMMSKIPKIPNLPKLLGNPKESFGDTSLKACMMPPPVLQDIPDIDENTQYYLNEVKKTLDADVIQPYIALGADLPHLLADGFEQFFNDNARYKEIMHSYIGDRVIIDMNYVISTNIPNSNNRLSPSQKGGTTCDGKPQVDWESIIRSFLPLTTFNPEDYVLKFGSTSTESSGDDIEVNTKTQIKATADGIKEELINKFSRKNGATFYEINTYIENLLYVIYTAYFSVRPHTIDIRNIENINITPILSKAIDTYIAENSKLVGGDGEEEGGGGGEGDKPPPKTGMFSSLRNTLKNTQSAIANKANAIQTDTLKRMSDVKNNVQDAAKQFKDKPVTSIKNAFKYTFRPKAVRSCTEKNKTVGKHQPSTYNMRRIVTDADVYAGQEINSILCKQKDTLKKLCVDVVLHHLSVYLEDVSHDTILFKKTKESYISCISTFCETIPDEIAYKMIEKYLFEDKTSITTFMGTLAQSGFSFETLVSTYDPYASIDFTFTSAKPVPELAKAEIKGGINSTELKYDFNPVKYNTVGPTFQTILSTVSSLIGFDAIYGATRALPRLVFTHLKEVVHLGIVNKPVLTKIFGLFDEVVFRSVDAINNQFEKSVNDIPKIMCRYLISKHSRTSILIQDSIFQYNHFLMSIQTEKTPTANSTVEKSITDNMIGFFIYHSIRHSIDKSTTIDKIYSEYAQKVTGLKYKTWADHPLASYFNKLTNGVVRGGKPRKTRRLRRRKTRNKRKPNRSRRYR
jgi:hypothetical protein